MADWFKFYNDGLDSKGMQFAISEQPLVTSVWLVILSEASKNRSNKVHWSDKDFELIGTARRINVSVPVLNQSIGILERIEYIRRENGYIVLNGWHKMQSDYAKGLDRGYYNKTNETLASHSLDTSVRGEERRGEEKRRKEIKKEIPQAKTPAVKVSKIPHPEHSAFIKGWTENYKAAFGCDYAFEGGKDGTAASKLLKMGIQRIDLLEIAKKAWGMKSNPYLAQRAVTIHGFKSTLNEIRVQLQNGVIKRPEHPNTTAERLKQQNERNT